MIDVLLVVPSYEYKTKPLTSSVKEYAGVAFLASALRQRGFSVRILDADLHGYDSSETVRQIALQKPAVVGITVLQVAAQSAVEIVAGLRATGYRGHVTAGGHFPSFAVGELFAAAPGLDSIVYCEGEDTLVELAETVLNGGGWQKIDGLARRQDGNVLFNPPRPLIQDLDTLSFQARDTLSTVIARGGHAAIITSRGCYGNCGFCSVNAFYKKAPGAKWRARSPENVVEEIARIAKDFHTDVFVFNDDNFFGPGNAGKRRARGIAEEILRRKLSIRFAIPASVNEVSRDLFRCLKAAGLTSVFLGIESMQQADLNFFNKHTSVDQNRAAIEILEEVGIFYQMGFILFHPHSTLSSVRKNITYLKEKVLPNPYCGTQFFAKDLKVLHGTAIAKKLEGKLSTDEPFYYSYAIEDPAVETLRWITDHLIVKKTFPYMVKFKDDTMEVGLKRGMRKAICELQFEKMLEAVALLENHRDITPGQLKKMMRELTDDVKALQERLGFLQKRAEARSRFNHAKTA